MIFALIFYILQAEVWVDFDASTLSGNDGRTHASWSSSTSVAQITCPIESRIGALQPWITKTTPTGIFFPLTIIKNQERNTWS